MSQVLSEVRSDAGDVRQLIFDCPGCRCGHLVTVSGPGGGARWTWNGSLEKPTFSPSYLVLAPAPRCHSFIRDGRIQFLSDCEHDLRGQTVDLPPIDDVRTGGDLG